MRIAFFGGSFDPPHHGHVAIAKAAVDRFALDQVLFAPVASQPLKPSAAPFLDRYAMTVLATQADPRFVPSLLDAPQKDVATGRPNYTVDTLGRLRASLGEEAAAEEASSAEGSSPERPIQAAPLFTLLGADSWLNIAHWYDAARLLTLSDWIVAARPGFSLARAARALPPQVVAEPDAAEDSLLLRHVDASPTRVFFLPDTHEEVSATELRQAIAGGRAAAGLLPAAVAEYIRKTGLYQDSHPAG